MDGKLEETRGKKPGKEGSGIGTSERKVTEKDGSSASSGREAGRKNPGKEGSGIGASEQKVTEKERSSAPTVNEKRKKQHPRGGQTNIPDLRIKP